MMIMIVLFIIFFMIILFSIKLIILILIIFIYYTDYNYYNDSDKFFNVDNDEYRYVFHNYYQSDLFNNDDFKDNADFDV